MRIYKYVLRAPNHQNIALAEMPVEARVLSVACQKQVDGEYLVVWAEVPETRGEEKLRHFLVVNTGTQFSWPYGKPSFLGTAIASTGIVWHIYQIVDGGW